MVRALLGPSSARSANEITIHSGRAIQQLAASSECGVLLICYLLEIVFGDAGDRDPAGKAFDRPREHVERMLRGIVPWGRIPQRPVTSGDIFAAVTQFRCRRNR